MNTFDFARSASPKMEARSRSNWFGRVLAGGLAASTLLGAAVSQADTWVTVNADGSVTRTQTSSQAQNAGKNQPDPNPKFYYHPSNSAVVSTPANGGTTGGNGTGATGATGTSTGTTTGNGAPASSQPTGSTVVNGTTIITGTTGYTTPYIVGTQNGYYQGGQYVPIPVPVPPNTQVYNYYYPAYPGVSQQPYSMPIGPPYANSPTWVTSIPLGTTYYGNYGNPYGGGYYSPAPNYGYGTPYPAPYYQNYPTQPYYGGYGYGGYGSSSNYSVSAGNGGFSVSVGRSRR